MQIAEQQFTADCPWPTIRAQWLTRFAQSARTFVADEVARQAKSQERLTELSGKIAVGRTGVTLVCKADRIDLTQAGEALIYDYKTGSPPSPKQQEKFDSQLLLEAAMVTQGAFDRIGRKPVQDATFIGVNTQMKNVAAPLKDNPPDQVWLNLIALLQHWREPDRGYVARLAHVLKTDSGPYDHLSRFGEWDTSQTAVPVMLT